MNLGRYIYIFTIDLFIFKCQDDGRFQEVTEKCLKHGIDGIFLKAC